MYQFLQNVRRTLKAHLLNVLHPQNQYKFISVYTKITKRKIDNFVDF